jgi:hypothetical protein
MYHTTTVLLSGDKYMPLTVNAAFAQFLKDTVNLDPDKTKSARSSRDWLYGQISSFGNDTTFPVLHPDYNINYGSFARKTKIRPLDDIDMMIGLHAQGATYWDGGVSPITLTVTPSSNLTAFCNENTYTLNSIKVINKFIRKCEDVPQYSKAEIERNGSAAMLNLKSYDWSFDIVPCFMTVVELNGRNYYLIPDGSGNWKKTDPRIDRKRATDLNSAHDGHVLNVLRIIKYWNRRPTMPSMSSYLLETMILDYYSAQTITASEYVDIEIPNVLAYIATAVNYQVNDSKGIQGNLNDLSGDERNKISARATSDKQKADVARSLETDGDHKGSIQKWGEVFGSEFPAYG